LNFVQNGSPKISDKSFRLAAIDVCDDRQTTIHGVFWQNAVGHQSRFINAGASLPCDFVIAVKKYNRFKRIVCFRKNAWTVSSSKNILKRENT
jgi:hypothetical protein